MWKLSVLKVRRLLQFIPIIVVHEYTLHSKKGLVKITNIYWLICVRPKILVNIDQYYGQYEQNIGKNLPKCWLILTKNSVWHILTNILVILTNIFLECRCMVYHWGSYHQLSFNVCWTPHTFASSRQCTQQENWREST